MGRELAKRSLVANHGRKIADIAAFTHKKTPRPVWEAAFCSMTREEELLVLGRPGSDLLSQGLSHSTIGAEEFNGRVRDGIGFMLLARTTRPAKHKETKQARSRSDRAQSSGLSPKDLDQHARSSHSIWSRAL